MLVRVLNKENFIKKNLKSTNAVGEKRLYSFKEIGNVVEYLVNNFYQHEFTKRPYNAMNHEMVEKILADTVTYMLPLKFRSITSRCSKDSFGKKKIETIGIFTQGSKSLMN